jgi:amidase
MVSMTSKLASTLALLLALLLLPAAAPAATPGTDDPVDCLRSVAGLDLQTVTVPQLQEAMAEGRLTSRQLVEAYLERIDAYEPIVNGVREIHPDALGQADRLDAERRAGKVRGPLHGIPVLLKDNIGTDDMPTTAGSIALEGSIPLRDAHLTARLREEGAVVLGKAELAEFANWMDPQMPNGYSSLGGQVINSYQFTRNPTGSSSGSATSGAMALATLTVGSETSGSILAPSELQMLAAVKPTVGLVSRAGVIPLAPSWDTAGPMVRNVTDAAILLGGMTGVDPRDPATAASAGKVPADGYLPALRDDALKGARLGVQNRSGQSATMRAAFAELERQGATIVAIEDFNNLKNVGLSEFGAVSNEFKTAINRYLVEETRPDLRVKSLLDIILFNQNHPDKVKYGQKWLQISQANPGVYETTIPNSVATTTSAQQVIDYTLSRYNLDAILSTGYSNANIGAAAGYPTVAVPAGITGTSPTNLAFLGTAWTEAKLLGYAYDFEQATLHRVPPTLVNPGPFADVCGG